MIDTAWASARRLLLVRLDNLGDVLVTTPAIHAVRQSLPDAHLTLLCSPVGSQAARLNPDIDSVIVCSAPWMDVWGTLPLSPSREQDLIAQLARNDFDGAIIFTSFRQSALPAAYLCYLAGIPLRAGASLDGAGSLLTNRYKHESDVCQRFPHEVQRSLDLVQALGMETNLRRLRLEVPESARLAASTLISEYRRRPGPVVVVHPGCSMPARTYPKEQFRDVVRLLNAELHATVFVTGVDEERELAAYVAGLPPTTSGDRVPEAGAAGIVVAGDLEFPELCALIEAADLTICANTGPMHIASAVGTPVVTVFALTNPPTQWGPWQVAHRQLYVDVPCRICYSRVCPHNQQCLRGVSPREVVASATELWKETSHKATSRREKLGEDRWVWPRPPTPVLPGDEPEALGVLA